MSSPAPSAPLPLAALLATPVLLAFNLPPSSSLLTPLLAFTCWGLLLLAAPRAGALLPAQGTWWRRLPALEAAGAGLLVGMAWSLQQGWPESQARAGILAVLAAIWVFSWAQQQAIDGLSIGRGLLLAGVISAGVAVVQVFVPAWADGDWVARSGLVGRAVGNLRQPNHLSTVLVWGLIWWVPFAAAWAPRLNRAGRLAVWALAAAMVLGVVLTASRTGMVGVVLLALWGVLDRRLPRAVRVSLVAAPLLYLVCWAAMAAWAHQTQHTFGGEARLAEGDLSASRFGIWANTLALIRAQPWTGVGWGEFNFAWTLTPFPGRPVAFFDHSHNLPLNLLVELGVVLGGLVLLLLLWALLQAGLRAWARSGDDGLAARAAFMTVLLVGLHSLLEYPLWYAYFLLPTAWAWGFALRPALPSQPLRRASLPAWRVGGLLMLLGGLWAAWDYSRVVVIYKPPEGAAPLSQRIAAGQDSLLFAHHADYAAATSTEPPTLAMGAFRTTTHSLLDTRLMIAWARALQASGHEDKARYLAARLREFRNPAAAEFFAACEGPAPLPFQCQPPQQVWHWRAFMP